METIKNTYTNITSFKSRLNPIVPTKMSSKWGEICIREANYKELKQPKFINTISKFLCKNFASFTKDPNWLVYNTKNKSLKSFIEDDMSDYIKNIINKNDENFTLLLAKDKNHKIRGVAISYPLDSIPNCKNTTLAIDSIAIDKAYRGIGLGKRLLLKILNTNKNTFTDAFLTGEKLAEGFYKKLGFKELNKNNVNQKFIQDYIGEQRNDYPQYIKLFSTILQPDKPRWYDVAVPLIKEKSFK